MEPEYQPDKRLLQRLRQLRQVPPRDREAATRGRAKFLAEVELLRQNTSKLPSRSPKGGLISTLFQRKERFSLIATLLSIFVTLVLLFGGAGATAYASQSALPGDALYKVKTLTEDARLAFTADKSLDALLYNEYVQRRLSEIESLASQGRYHDIPMAASRFEFQVRQAALNLETIAGKDPIKARNLSDGLRQSLTQQAQLKNRLRSGQTEFEFIGIVDSMAIDRWTISGQVVMISPQTKISETILPGDPVKVEALVAEDGSLTANQIEALEKSGDQSFEMAGIVESMAAANWVVDGRTVLITSQTEINQSIQTGDYVKIEGVLTMDGSLVASVIKLAENDQLDGNGNEEIGNTNDNQDDNEEIGNANSNEEIGNANDDENDNEEIGNANDNQNDNEEIGNTNNNQNDNEEIGNANDNQNENLNENGNGSGEDNGNDQEIDHENTNQNENSNVNGNGNENDHGGDSQNNNSNENGND